MISLTDEVLFGDIWERAELSPRDRSLITDATLIATGSTEHTRPPRQSTSQRPDADRAQGGNHPPRVLRRLAKGHVRPHRREQALNN